MTTHQISEQAASAREQARNPDGTFGSYPAAETDPAGVLGDGSGTGDLEQLRTRLQTALTPEDVTDDDLRTILAHPSGPDRPAYAPGVEDSRAMEPYDEDYETHERRVDEAYGALVAWDIPMIRGVHLSNFDPDDGQAEIYTFHGNGATQTSFPVTASELTEDPGTAGEARLNAARNFLVHGSVLHAQEDARREAALTRRVHNQSVAASDMAAPGSSPEERMAYDRRTARDEQAEGQRLADGYAILAAFPGQSDDDTIDLMYSIRQGSETVEEDLAHAREETDRHRELVGTNKVFEEQTRQVRRMLEVNDRADLGPGMRMVFPNMDPVTRQQHTDALVQAYRDRPDDLDRIAEHGQRLNGRIMRMLQIQHRAGA